MGTTIAVVGVALLAALIGLVLYAERGRPLLPSTWRMMRSIGLRGLFSPRSLHGYVYGRWPKQYLELLINRIYPRLGPRWRKWLADRYHSKVLTPEQSRAIITLDRKIPLQDLEQIIPYPMARQLVLDGPPDVAVQECYCRHARREPCQPTQVCMAIGQPFVDFVLEHHPRTSRRLSQTEALQLLAAEHERGHVHSAWFKDALMDRFYAICNCCPCCCAGIEAMVRHETPMMASSGYVADVDEALCVGCGACEEVCPFDAIQVEGKAAVEWENCMGCGVCVSACPNDGISLVRDERKGQPLDVRLLA
ncbi:MAG: 4Fe-4S binding protein [Candidatus Brocadiaceae bacterium]|jgi:ferredoxin